MKIVHTLFISMFIFALVACGNKKNSNDTKDTQDSSSTTQKENKPENKTESALTGEWSLVSINGEKQGVMNLTFDKDGHISMASAEGNVKGTFTQSEDGKSIIIKTSDTEEDTWEIKSISENELILLDADPDKPSVISEYVFKR